MSDQHIVRAILYTTASVVVYFALMGAVVVCAMASWKRRFRAVIDCNSAARVYEYLTVAVPKKGFYRHKAVLAGLLVVLSCLGPYFFFWGEPATGDSIAGALILGGCTCSRVFDISGMERNDRVAI